MDEGETFEECRERGAGKPGKEKPPGPDSSCGPRGSGLILDALVLTGWAAADLAGIHVPAIAAVG